MNDLIGRVIIGLRKEGDLLIIYLDNNAEINTTIRYKAYGEEGVPYQNSLYYDRVNYHVIPEGEI